MRTTPHAHTDRRSTPRRLVPRRDVANRIMNSLSAPTPRFHVADILTVQAADGQRHVITILGTHEDGRVDGMVYDGLPHLFPTTIEFLAGLRVIEVGEMDPTDVISYRLELELPVWCEEVAA